MPDPLNHSAAASSRFQEADAAQLLPEIEAAQEALGYRDLSPDARGIWNLYLAEEPLPAVWETLARLRARGGTLPALLEPRRPAPRTTGPGKTPTGQP